MACVHACVCMSPHVTEAAGSLVTVWPCSGACNMFVILLYFITCRYLIRISTYYRKNCRWACCRPPWRRLPSCAPLLQFHPVVGLPRDAGGQAILHILSENMYNVVIYRVVFNCILLCLFRVLLWYTFKLIMSRARSLLP